MTELVSPKALSDIPAFQNEWAALLECVSPARDYRCVFELLRSFDWPRLLLLAEEHGVTGHLAGSLRDAGESSISIPPEIRQLLLDRQRAQNFQTLRLTTELFRLLEVFAANRIGALVIKGPVLAMRAYGDPAVRRYGDLDLLVRQQDIRCATESMIAGGYHAAVPLSAIHAGKIPGQYLFSKPDSNVIVELHNDRTLRYFPRPLPIEDFFARQIQARLDTHEVPALAVEDELVLICIHGAKHFWERLMWIADVAGLVSRQTDIDWIRAEASARAVRTEHLLHTGLRLAMDVLHAEPPKLIATRVREDTVAAKLVARVLHWLPAAGYAPPGLFERAAFRLRMRGNFLAAPAYLLKLSLSPTEEDWRGGGWVSNNPFLEAFRRPFRLARKYGRGRRI
jgi:putative nucleotidyltransferase-like protein